MQPPGLRDYNLLMQTLLKALPPLLLLLCLVDSALAQGVRPAHPYGRDYALAAPVRAITRDTPQPEAIDPKLARAAVQRLEARVEELGWNDGPYAASLAEPLSDLARQLDSLGRRDEALQQRERALHVLRVNEGLYSENQVPLVRTLLAADRLRGDVQGMDQRYDYLFRLYGNGQAPYTEERIDVALEFLGWQREAVLRVIDGNPLNRLLAMYAINRDLFDALLEDSGAQWPWIRDVGLSQLRNFYALAVTVEPDSELQHPQLGVNPAPIDRRRLDELDLQRERALNLARGLRAKGQKLLDQLLARAPEGVERARLLRENGDWQLWLGLPSSAGKNYRSSREILLAAGAEERVKTWFGAPQPVPQNDVFADAVIREGRTFAARLSVDDSGRVRKVAVDDLPGGERDAHRLQRALRATRFRPVLNVSTGEAEPATLETQFIVYRDALPRIQRRY